MDISKSDLKAALSYRPLITASASKHGVDAATVAGIGSRESGWGTGSDMKPKGPMGTGDWAKRKPRPPLRDAMPPDGLGFGRGLMQADWDASNFARTGNWQDPAANIDFGCNELANNIAFFAKKGLSHGDANRAAIAAYNRGPNGVWSDIQAGGMAKVDSHTAHGNYSADVIARSDFFRTNGFGKSDISTIAEALLSTSLPANLDAHVTWPAEGSPGLDAFFGPIKIDESGLLVKGWEEEHLVTIDCPWKLTLSWDHTHTTTHIRCNRKVAVSLSEILANIWQAYGRDQAAVTRARMHLYGGCFEFRRKRGLSGLSMHAYGAAIDFDPDGNPMYNPGQPPIIHMPSVVVEAFKTAGWRWGNDFSGRKDPMHFQATS